MEIEFRGGCAYIRGIENKPIKIPSAMYPLAGEPLYLTSENTSAFEGSKTTETIRNIFDGLPNEVGRCYTNAERLQTALAAEGFDAKTLVGWLFVLGTRPVHHCFTCIDNHIMDYNVRPELLTDGFPSSISREEMRKLMADRVMELSMRPSSETGTFGALSSGSFFIGSYCPPKRGRELYNKLMRAYPKHPTALGLNPDGASPLQRIVLDRQKKNP